MNYSSRFWLFAPLALFLLLALAAMGRWWFVADAMERRLDALNGHEAAPGITLSFAGKAVSGFPFRVDVVFTGLKISGRAAHGPFAWESERFALHALTYGRTQDIYEAAGTQRLRWTDGGGRGHAIRFLPASLRASAIADRRGLSRFDLDILDAGGSDDGGGKFTLDRAQLHLRRDPDGEDLDLVIQGDGIESGGIPVLGPHVRSMRLYATFSHGAAFAPLLAGRASWPDAAAAWRRAGGRIALGPVEIQSSGLNLSAQKFADTGDDLRGLLDPLY